MQVLARWQHEGSFGRAGIAQIYARLSERDKAIAILEDAYRKHEWALYAIAAEPLFTAFRCALPSDSPEDEPP